MLDIQKGLAWANRAVAYIENLMVEDKVDGVFLDVIGARLWKLANWESWPQWEKDAWTAGAVDLMRRLDASRRALNPRFIIINNNVWDGAGTAGKTAEQYVDGICLEHITMDDYHTRVAGNAYSNLGHRRVIAVGRDTAEAQAWAGVQGVTHVSNQTNYASVTPPPVGFHRLTDRPKTFGRTTIGTKPPVGMGANQKRGSKFTLPDRATLLSFSAYLDGLGATSGSQPVRMVLYRDNAGVPVARVAQSTNVVTIDAGDQPRWFTFTAPATALDPGEYWISIHTGDTEGVARNRGDGAANWYSSIDPFSDGPSDPFGAGWTGTITLSVNVTYTMGY